ncbi:N-acetylmuramoyl-L-alanine amidase [Vibrio phage 1.240.O._10N.261.52.F8]|nr:N-acetylmuramoyl-L-alanine amidase [Vibrio phage 1.240.O._10N.261.52.F8]
MNIKYITVHCSATKPSQKCNAEIMDGWHKSRGWSGLGYHFVILRDGELETGRPLNKQGAHVAGYNKDNVGVCLVGGVDENNKPVDNFTSKQMDALRYLITELAGNYGVKRQGIKGHRDWGAKKACPCFDVQERMVGWND